MTETAYFSDVTLPLGDNEYPFRLLFKAVSDWEHQNNRSIYSLFNEWIATRSARLEDVRGVLHMGLIGAGMDAPLALSIIKRFVVERPIVESHPVALAVLEAFLFGNDAYRAEKEIRDVEE